MDNSLDLTELFMEKLPDVQQLLDIAPWASEEIEDFIQIGEHLIEKQLILESVVEEQKSEIDHLLKNNQNIIKLNKERLEIYDEMEIKIQEMEQENERLKDDKATSYQCIQSLSETISALEEKNAMLQETLQKTESDIENYQKQVHDLSSELDHSKDSLLDDEISHLQQAINAANKKLDREISMNKTLQCELNAKISDYELLEQKYESQVLSNTKNESKLNCSCYMSSLPLTITSIEECDEENFGDFKLSELNDFVETSTPRNKSQKFVFVEHPLITTRRMSNNRLSLGDELMLAPKQTNLLPVQKVDCGVQTDTKYLCLIAEEENNEVFERNIQKKRSNFKHLCRLLRKIFPKKRGNVKTELTLNNTYMIHTDRYAMECLDPNISHYSKTISKSIKNIPKDLINQTEFSLVNMSSEESTSSVSLENSTKSTSKQRRRWTFSGRKNLPKD